MPINSMTGFARVDGAFSNYRWTWELKSVNSKGLDVRCRVPNFLDGLDLAVKKRISTLLNRGSVFVSLNVETDGEDAVFTVNKERLENLLDIAKSYEGSKGVAPASLDGLLNIKGVIDLKPNTMSDELKVEFEAKLLQSLATGAMKLADARSDEGARMHDVLKGQLVTIENLIEQASSVSENRVELMKERFTSQLQKLYDGQGQLSEDRLAQEIATIAVKADVCEEIDRLKCHVAEGRLMLDKSEPIGRRLDFLTQEFNREANTLCSKASDVALTRIGVDLKTVIDQFREQVQNIE